MLLLGFPGETVSIWPCNSHLQGRTRIKQQSRAGGPKRRWQHSRRDPPGPLQFRGPHLATNRHAPTKCWLLQDSIAHTKWLKKISIPPPPHTFAGTNLAYHLNRNPNFKMAIIEDVSQQFNLPDLRSALAEYMAQVWSGANPMAFSINAWQRAADSLLPFSHLQVWNSFCLQLKTYHAPNMTNPPQQINAFPPSKKLPFGQADPVIYNVDSEEKWLHSSLTGFFFIKLDLILTNLSMTFLKGHQIGQVQLIFRIISLSTHASRLHDCFLTYIHCFDIVPQPNPSLTGFATARGPYPEPASSMYIVKRVQRSNNTLIGSILPLQQIQSMVNLVPRFGKKADWCLTKTNSLAYSTEFWLNKYFDKELFYALESAQSVVDSGL